MVPATSFEEVVEAIDQLSLEDQETLMDLLRRRIAAQGRKQIVADIQEAQKEFEAGSCKPVSVDDLMKEIQS